MEHILHELEKEYRQSVVAKLAALGREIPPGVDPLDIAMESDFESTDAGSNSSESDGPPVHLIGKVRLNVIVHCQSCLRPDVKTTRTPHFLSSPDSLPFYPLTLVSFSSSRNERSVARN